MHNLQAWWSCLREAPSWESSPVPSASLSSPHLFLPLVPLNILPFALLTLLAVIPPLAGLCHLSSLSEPLLFRNDIFPVHKCWLVLFVQCCVFHSNFRCIFVWWLQAGMGSFTVSLLCIFFCTVVCVCALQWKTCAEFTLMRFAQRWQGILRQRDAQEEENFDSSAFFRPCVHHF